MSFKKCSSPWPVLASPGDFLACDGQVLISALHTHVSAQGAGQGARRAPRPPGQVKTQDNLKDLKEAVDHGVWVASGKRAPETRNVSVVVFGPQSDGGDIAWRLILDDGFFSASSAK